MSATPAKDRAPAAQYKTPKKSEKSRKRVGKTADGNPSSGTDDSSSCVEVIVLDTSDDARRDSAGVRKSGRKKSPTKKYQQYLKSGGGKREQQQEKPAERRDAAATERSVADLAMHVLMDRDEEDGETASAPLHPSVVCDDLQLLHEETGVAGRSMFGFNTPKKRDAMVTLAMNTPKTPKTPKTARLLTKTPDTKRRKQSTEPKTPSHVRHRVRNQIAQMVKELSDEDFSGDESDFMPSASSDSDDATSSGNESAADDEPKTPHKVRRPIVVPVLPKTPSAARARQTARAKRTAEYVPESDGYFQAHSNSKIVTSDHTLDRLKNPRLPADRLFSLLAAMKLSPEHETTINAMMEEYRSYFAKWMCVLNEGYNLLLYGLGSKRQLLQSFHREVLAKQTVLVVNGFFPSLTLKDILDSITGEILDAGASSANAHEAVDMIEEEFALIPDTHLYLIVHNLDGAMLRNAKAQAIISRLARVPNIHLLATIDHINTPLLWDQTKLSNYNFSWWDCTTMLPYTDETAFENSLLVQNSGELALSSMRSVFSSLTTNSRGIYMVIVKYQLKNKGNPNYQGLSFKDLYSSCRESFLVSSDLALRAQLTEFLDHKLVKSKRSVDGSEQLNIPIDSALLQQFLDEHEKK